jgi:hypothetical protein
MGWACSEGRESRPASMTMEKAPPDVMAAIGAKALVRGGVAMATMTLEMRR